MRSWAMTVAALALMASPLAAQAPVPSVERLGWLEGTWAGEKDGVWMGETWTSARGGRCSARTAT